MEGKINRIESFTDLKVWKEGHKLVLMIYKKTENFPKEERYGLTSQLQRATVSITSNIAEGFARHTYKEKIRFYYVASGSLAEVQNQLLVARDVEILRKDDFSLLSEQTVLVHKILNGFITSTKKFIE